MDSAHAFGGWLGSDHWLARLQNASPADWEGNWKIEQDLPGLPYARDGSCSLWSSCILFPITPRYQPYLHHVQRLSHPWQMVKRQRYQSAHWEEAALDLAEKMRAQKEENGASSKVHQAADHVSVCFPRANGATGPILWRLICQSYSQRVPLELDFARVPRSYCQAKAENLRLT